MTAGARTTGVLPLIGDTPLVRVTRLDTGPCELWLKLESHNPGGSIEDRVARAMIDAAEASGELKPGGHIVEAAAGNLALGLALVAAVRGHKLTLIVSDKVNQDTILQLKALGARCVITRGDVEPGHPQHAQELARRIARDEVGWLADHLANPAGARAHEATTGPEIWAQTDGRLDAVVCGLDAGGSQVGLSRYFAQVDPGVQVIGADAAAIPDGEAFAVVRELRRAEGVLAGTSSGALIAAALRWCRAQPEPRRVVALVLDSGGRHLSAAYNDQWLDEQGLSVRPATGDLRELVARRAREGGGIYVGPDDTLAVAYARMRSSDVSQLPVLEGKRLVGIVDESDMLLAALGDAARGAASFARPVREVMSPAVQTLAPTAGVHQLLPLFDRGMVGIVVDGDELLGLVTRVDLLNYLRRRAG
jgi:cystathionine beta-synthase